jgi:hypothetical protein
VVRVSRKTLLAFILMTWFALSFSMAWAQEDKVIQAQRLLSTLGYDLGIADGILGPQTRQAIAAYQHSQNLPATGELDTATLTALGLMEAPQIPDVPPAPTPPPTPWRPVLVYLRYYDTQPSRVLPYVTEHFRQGLTAQAWISNTVRDIDEQDFLRLSWHIERVEPQEPEAASEATIEVYSRVRIAGEEMGRREIFSLVRTDKTTWLINDLQGSYISDANSGPRQPDEVSNVRQ